MLKTLSCGINFHQFVAIQQHVDEFSSRPVLHDRYSTTPVTPRQQTTSMCAL